jgi:hypothetical protein
MKRKSKAIGFLITGVALAVGIAISSGIIRNSYVADEVKAAGDYLYTFDSSGSYTSGISDGEIPSARVTIANTGGATITASFYKNSSATTTIFNNGAGETRLYGGAGDGGQLTFALSGDFVMKSVKVNTSTNNGYSVNGGSTITTSGVETALSDSTSVVIKNVASGTGQVRITDLVIGYSAASTKTLLSIAVSGTLNKTSYYAGESFDPAGLTISANYDDESSADVTSECTFLPDPLTAGVTLVTASYMEGGVTKTADITGITVSTRTLTSLEVTTSPSKVDYLIGQSFDPTGMVITATYDAGSPVVGYTNYSYSPTGALNVSGSTMITITSLENSLITTSLQVQVSALTSMTIVADDTGAATSGYNTYTFTKNGVEFTMVDIIKNGNNIQFRNGAFSMHNSTALPGSIMGITVYRAGGTPETMTLYTGSTSQQGVASGGTPDEYDSSSASFSWEVNGSLGHNYFRLFNFAGSGELTFSSIEIDFLSEPEANEDAIAWGTDFLSATAAGCSALDQSQLLTTWSGLETSFNALSSEAKNYLTSLTPNVTGNDAQHAVARYIYIISKYGDTTFADFMNLDIQAAPSVSDLLDDGYNYVPLITVIGVVGLTVLIGYYYLKKRQEA